MKRVLSFVLCVMLVITSLVPVVSAEKRYDESFWEAVCRMAADYDEDTFFSTMSIKIGVSEIIVDGKTHRIDDSNSIPYVENGRTMMPVRGIAEAIGAEVSYDDDEQEVTIECDDTVVLMTIGEEFMEVNGESVSLLNAPEIINDRTMLPVRDVAEALDCTVEWLEDIETAVFTRPLQTKRIIAHKENVGDYNQCTSVSGEGMTVMQFDTIDEAANAMMKLRERGIDAEPDYVRTLDVMSWGVDMIGSEEYYDVVESYSDSAVVAVVDSGIDFSHSLFKGRIKGGYDIFSTDNDPQDLMGHGTHVAGTVLDVAGFNPDISIMPVKIFGSENRTYSATIAAGIMYAADNGADVINLSLGGIGYSSIEQEAIDYARDRGVAVVAAAGNDSMDISVYEYSPACLDGVITVSAVDENGRIASFSNYGDGIIDFTAPGVDIKSARLGGGYVEMNGTSMATPHVAGVYALVKAANPHSDVDDITAMLADSAIEKNNSRLYGNGFICVDGLGDDDYRNESGINIIDEYVYDVTEDNAVVATVFEYLNVDIDYIGVQLGTSKNSLSEVYRERMHEDSTGFMEFECNLYSDADLELDSGTTYYTRVFAEYDDEEIFSDIMRFDTAKREEDYDDDDDYDYEDEDDYVYEPDPNPLPEPEPEPEPEPIKSQLRIVPEKYPSGSLSRGESFGLSGRIKSDCHITDVRAYMLDSNKNVVMEASGWTTTQTYVIEGSALDRGMKFNNLSEGTYYLKYEAADESGNRVSWISDAFRIEGGSSSTLRILPEKYPTGTIRYGKAFGLSGRIKSNCHITDVRAYMLDSNKNVVMEASGWTTTQTYVIEGSALDRGMKFNNLGRGGYYLRYTAADESGNFVSWTSDMFYVE